MLRPYQAALVEVLRGAYRDGAHAPLLQLPTGGGKTVVAGEIVRRTRDREHRVLILVHRRELVRQFVETLHRHGLDADVGTVQSGRAVESTLPVQVASVPMLARDPSVMREPKLIITDEAHHSPAETYQRIYAAFPRARRLGLSATPARLDGQGLADGAGGLALYDRLIEGPSVRSLIEAGHLCDYEIYAPESYAEDGVRTVETWQQYGRGQTLVFARSREHGRDVAERFSAVGVAAGYVDGSTAETTRDQTLAAFERRDLQVLVSVNILVEGYDCPAAECAVLARPTNSQVVHLQQIGRVLRPAEGKTALVLDLVGNCRRLGGPRAARTWTLSEGVSRDTDDGPESAPTPAEREPTPREMWEEMAREVTLHRLLDEDAAPLELPTGPVPRHVLKRLVRDCRTLADMSALGARLGYSQRWAAKQIELREAGRARWRRAG